VIFLKYSQGFTRPVPSIATAGTIAVSFVCMSQALKSLPMGTVYAVWTGIGAAGGMIWGILVFGEPATAMRILCISLILAGVVGLKLG
jgi:quaternary ammonium compound-resistance protein SugE